MTGLLRGAARFSRYQQMPRAAAGLLMSPRCSRAIVRDGSAGAAGVRDQGHTRTPSPPLRASRHRSHARLRGLPTHDEVRSLVLLRKRRCVRWQHSDFAQMVALTDVSPQHCMSASGRNGRRKDKCNLGGRSGCASSRLARHSACPELCRLNQLHFSNAPAWQPWACRLLPPSHVLLQKLSHGNLLSRPAFSGALSD